MGCDGGTIPTRDELVRTKKKPEQKDKDSERMYRWNNCALTQERLRRPVVACQMGRMYNKEAIIEWMLARKTGNGEGSSSAARNMDHIKGIKDIRELQLTDNPSFGEDDANSAKSAGNNYDDRSRSPWICPVTSIEMNGKFRFVFDWADGRVLSERAYKMVKEDEATRIFERNMVLMNPESESDVDLMATRMEARKAREKADKKAKKEKRKADDAGFKAPAAPVNGASSSSSGAPATNGESTSAEAKKAKVTEAKKKENPAANGAADKKEKKAGVQSDPTKSEVYKSLFSSHKSAQNKQTGHWVTFDPRYN